MRSSPRASIGLIIWPASMAPSAAPAPTMVCISSMNVMISPSASVISLRTALSRSSNSPRYLAPAIIEPRSRAMRRLCFRPSGTSPASMRLARPSTMAVLPTPGSPISTGLFLVRRRQHLDDPADLVVAADDRVDLAVVGRLGEVAPVLLEGLELLLGVLAGDAVAAADVAQRAEQLLPVHAQAIAHGHQEVLDRQVVVAQLLAQGVGLVEDLVGLPAGAGLGAAVGLGQLGHGLVGPVAHHERGQAELLHDGQHDRVVLAQEGGQEMIGRQLGVAVGAGRLEGGGHRLLRLRGPGVRVERHGTRLSRPARSCYTVTQLL